MCRDARSRFRVDNTRACLTSRKIVLPCRPAPRPPPRPLSHFDQLDCLKFLLSLPNIDTEIQNVQGKRAGEGMEELMRDESKDEETVRLLTESRVSQGITRL